MFAVLEVEGMKAIKKLFGDSVRVYFVETDTAVLETRMRQRGDSEESIQKRLAYLEEHQEQSNKQFADFVKQWNLRRGLATIQNLFKSLTQKITIKKRTRHSLFFFY